MRPTATERQPAKNEITKQHKREKQLEIKYIKNNKTSKINYSSRSV